MKKHKEDSKKPKKIKTYTEFKKISDEVFGKAGIIVGEIDWSTSDGYGVVFTGSKNNLKKEND